MKPKVSVVLVVAAVLIGAIFHVAERADARGLGKLILSPIAKSIGKVQGKSYSRGTSDSHSGRILSKQELRSCVGLQTDIETAEAKLLARESALPSTQNIDSLALEIDQSEREINELHARIESAEPLVNVYSESSVNNYNAMVRKSEIKVNEHNALVTRYQKLADAYNSKLAQYKKHESEFNGKVDRFNSECAHSYYVDDMNAILAEKRASANTSAE